MDDHGLASSSRIMDTRIGDLSFPEADPGGVRGFNAPQDYPADSEIWRKGVADRL